MMKTPASGLVITLTLLVASPLSACQYTVRDVGFVELESQPYTLYILPDKETETYWNDLSASEGATLFLETNIELSVLSPDIWMDHADIKPLVDRIDSLPRMVLVAAQGEALILDNPIRVETSLPQTLAYLQSLFDSPLRKNISQHLVRSHCLTLLVEGEDKETNSEWIAGIEGVHERLTQRLDELPKAAKEGPKLMLLTPGERERESILLWSLGIDLEQLSNPAVAIIFGRGRAIGPIMIGDELSLKEIERRIGLIGESCECELDRSWMQGTRIPLNWNRDLQDSTAKTLGFDAENPMVKMEISQILDQRPGHGPSMETLAFSNDPLFGYSESEVIQFDLQDPQNDAPREEIKVSRLITPNKPSQDSKEPAAASVALTDEGSKSGPVRTGHKGVGVEVTSSASLHMGPILVSIFFLVVLAVGFYILKSPRSTRGAEPS